MGKIEAVLFDMGGVIVQLEPLENVLGPTSLTSDEVWDAWLLSEAVRQFERGQCSVDHFAAEIVREMRLVGTADEFIDRFLAFPKGLYPGAVEMLAGLPANITTGVLSNTSAIHWENQRDADIVRGLCQRSYLSYELGVAKPDREIFDHAIADLGLAPAQVLFIDDNQINVAGAQAVGMQAGLAKGPEAATQVLRDFGVI